MPKTIATYCPRGFANESTRILIDDSEECAATIALWLRHVNHGDHGATLNIGDGDARGVEAAAAHNSLAVADRETGVISDEMWQALVETGRNYLAT